LDSLQKLRELMVKVVVLYLHDRSLSDPVPPNAGTDVAIITKGRVCRHPADPGIRGVEHSTSAHCARCRKA
jgi:hypothetical protein